MIELKRIKIVIWVISQEKILLKKEKDTWRPFEGWMREGESKLGTIQRVVQEIPLKTKESINLKEIRRENVNFFDKRKKLFHTFQVIHFKCEISLSQLALSTTYNLLQKEEAEEILPRYYSNIISKLFSPSFFI
jgi:hypothetical protein